MTTRTEKIRGVLFGMALCLLGARSYGQFPPAPGTGPGLPETVEAIERARVTTRILYVTAHPDDESSAVLTYLARGLHADVALLALTRGEGGQNDLGPEQAPQLGLIRTQELLAATRGYGVRLYFTRAKDFGFSKTPEETQKVWGEQVLEDMVLGRGAQRTRTPSGRRAVDPESRAVGSRSFLPVARLGIGEKRFDALG